MTRATLTRPTDPTTASLSAGTTSCQDTTSVPHPTTPSERSPRRTSRFARPAPLRESDSWPCRCSRPLDTSSPSRGSWFRGMPHGQPGTSRDDERFRFGIVSLYLVAALDVVVAWQVSGSPGVRGSRSGPEVAHTAPSQGFRLSKAGFQREEKRRAGRYRMASGARCRHEDGDRQGGVRRRGRRGRGHRPGSPAPIEEETSGAGKCSKVAGRYDKGEGRRRWRAHDVGLLRCYLEGEAPRVRCPTHGPVGGGGSRGPVTTPGIPTPSTTKWPGS